MPGRVAGVLARLGLVAGAILVMLVVLEVTLRCWPGLLGREFANGVTSRYTARAGGIYYRDRTLGMNFMLPNHTATMYANGYVWRHRTDALGFRNAPLQIPADVVLLGDSFVYGQGAEFEDTLGHRLQERSGLRVVNLGRQGDCVFQEAYLLTAHIDRFAPRFVVLVFSPNDIDDLYAWLSDAAMEAFVAQPVESIRYPDPVPTDLALRERAEAIRRRPLWTRVEEGSYVLKLIPWIRYMARKVGPAPASAAPRGAGAAVDRASLGWRYTDHAVAYMADLSRRRRARFLVVPIVTGPRLAILREVAGRHGVDVVDTAEFLAGPAFLPVDLHFSPEGARRLAQTITGALARERPLRVAGRAPALSR